MRRLLAVVALVLGAAVPARAQNCVTINGISRCAMPWQVYDTAQRQVSTPVLDLSQTWNQISVTFTGLKLNVTDTNSATGSLLLDLQVGGTSKFSVNKSGNLVAAGTFTPTGVVLLPNGTTVVPSLAFASQPGLGVYRSGANVLGFVNDGYSASAPNAILSSGGLTLAGTSQGFNFAPAADASASADTKMTRGGAGVVNVAHGTAASTAEFQVSGGNGGFISTVKALTELTTIAAAPTTSTAIQIPANAVVLAVSVRVVTVIPTAATFTVTSATPAKTWNTVAVPVAATTTDPGTAPGPSFQTTASVITITPNLTPGAATGQVRVTIFYYQVTPPTS